MEELVPYGVLCSLPAVLLALKSLAHLGSIRRSRSTLLLNQNLGPCGAFVPVTRWLANIMPLPCWLRAVGSSSMLPRDIHAHGAGDILCILAIPSRWVCFNNTKLEPPSSTP